MERLKGGADLQASILSARVEQAFRPAFCRLLSEGLSLRYLSG
jgi:hypothetical protein